MDTPTHPRTPSSPDYDPQCPAGATPASAASASTAGAGAVPAGNAAAYTSHAHASDAGAASARSESATAQANEHTGAYWDDAREAARAKLNEHKDRAAGGIGEVAGALREAARRQRDDGAGQPIAQLTSSAAEGLEHLSDTLRNKDVGTMLRDMDRFARDQPLVFFGMALATGFLAVRFLKAGTD